MDTLLPPWPLFWAFVTASLVLALAPGPGVLYIVSRSLVQGRRAGLVSVAGVAAGNLGNAIAAALGLAALFALSATAFGLVRIAGALYLIWLGLLLLRTPAAATAAAPPPASRRRIFADAFVVALLNPKTMLFFAAFLPQFFAPGADPARQGLLLGAIFVAIAAATDALYALAAGAVAPRLARGATRRAGRRLGAGLFIGLGLFAALAGGYAEHR